MKFIVDSNAGKLVKWLRIMGYDTIFFDVGEDSEMVTVALAQDRILLTRDTEVMKRRVVVNGRLKAVLLRSDDPEDQMHQVMETLKLDESRAFTLCLEDNQPLEPRKVDEVKDRVPPYVLQTQADYMECPVYHRVYWKGTHWQAMNETLKRFNQP